MTSQKHFQDFLCVLITNSFKFLIFVKYTEEHKNGTVTSYRQHTKIFIIVIPLRMHELLFPFACIK